MRIRGLSTASDLHAAIDAAWARKQEVGMQARDVDCTVSNAHETTEGDIPIMTSKREIRKQFYVGFTAREREKIRVFADAEGMGFSELCRYHMLRLAREHAQKGTPLWVQAHEA